MSKQSPILLEHPSFLDDCRWITLKENGLIGGFPSSYVLLLEVIILTVATKATLRGSRHLEKKRWRFVNDKLCFLSSGSQIWRDGRWFCILKGSCLVSILVFDTGKSTPSQFGQKCTGMRRKLGTWGSSAHSTSCTQRLLVQDFTYLGFELVHWTVLAVLPGKNPRDYIRSTPRYWQIFMLMLDLGYCMCIPNVSCTICLFCLHVLWYRQVLEGEDISYSDWWYFCRKIHLCSNKKHVKLDKYMANLPKSCWRRGTHSSPGRHERERWWPLSFSGAIG